MLTKFYLLKFYKASITSLGTWGTPAARHGQVRFEGGDGG